LLVYCKYSTKMHGRNVNKIKANKLLIQCTVSVIVQVQFIRHFTISLKKKESASTSLLCNHTSDHNAFNTVKSWSGMRRCGNRNVFVTGSSLYDVLYWESVLGRVFKRVKREGGKNAEIHYCFGPQVRTGGTFAERARHFRSFACDLWVSFRLKYRKWNMYSLGNFPFSLLVSLYTENRI
jgi:hypothetical protein